MKHALPWETKWPRIKKGDYNGLFLASIYILYLGCHFYPSSTLTTTSSNNTLHGITIQASDSVAILRDTSILHKKTWANYLVLSFDGSMPCIHSPYSLLQLLQERL
jgi:hypothetical protein